MRYGNELAEDLETHDDCDGDNNNGRPSSPHSLGRTPPRGGQGGFLVVEVIVIVIMIKRKKNYTRVSPRDA